MKSRLPDREEHSVEYSSETLFENLRRSLQKIVDILADESQLPMGLRVRLIEELASLQEKTQREDLEPEALAWEIKSMAYVVQTYGDAVLRSESVKRIRLLDLELECYRQPYGLMPVKDRLFGDFDALYRRAS